MRPSAPHAKRPYWALCGALICVLGPVSAGQVAGAPVKLKLAGSVPGIRFGSSVAGVGDLNGDGQPEVIVGAPYASPSGNVVAGSAFVYTTDTGQKLFQIDGRREYGGLGDKVAGAGDVNGDGLPDLVIGAYGTFIPGVGQAGRAYVYSGYQSLLYKVDGNEHFGFLGAAVAGVGDVDGDGFADVGIGAFNEDASGLMDAGKVYVHSGATGSLAFELNGSKFLGWFGRSISGAGDVDGDGHDDIVVGAPAEPSGGAVYVYSGATQALLAQITGSSLNADYLGRAVAAAGDLDGDGIGDLLLGAPSTDFPSKPSAGAVYAYSVAQSQVLLTLPGKFQDYHFGESVANAGDVDGDGTPDIVAGARADPDGVVRVHSGKTGLVLLELVGGAGDHLGESVAGAGDIDGDGRHEVIIGVPAADPHGLQDAGMALIIGL